LNKLGVFTPDALGCGDARQRHVASFSLQYAAWSRRSSFTPVALCCALRLTAPQVRNATQLTHCNASGVNEPLVERIITNGQYSVVC